jgi:FkbM family methyltransferase
VRQVLAWRAVFGDGEEGRIIARHFSGTVGVFVDVGAFQPIAMSQTYQLEQEGWSGILVEPIAESAAALRRERRVPVFEVACGAPEHHGTMMPIKVAGGLSTLRMHELSAALQEMPSRDVRVVTLDSILQEAGINSIDLLSIDVEGMEVDVLRGFSLERVRPRVVLLEDFCDNLAKHRYMRSKGYRLVRRTGANSWYVPADTPFPVSAFGRWQLLRKYYLTLPIRGLKNILRRLRTRSSSLRAG